MTCTVDGCQKPSLSRGLCNGHYKKHKKYGDPLAGRPGFKGVPPLDRLLRRRSVTKSGCWEISGAGSENEYPTLRINGRIVKAHRFAYEHYVGPVPDGLILDHLCRNRHCANPEHLEPVTWAQNTLRGIGPTAVNAAKTHCYRGHPLDDAYIIPSTGGRQCRGCTRLRVSA